MFYPVGRRWNPDLAAGRGCAGPLGPFQQAEVALAILQRLTDAQAAVDAAGQPLLPLPIAHRHIASQRCLPHIVQVVGGRCFSLLLHLPPNDHCAAYLRRLCSCAAVSDLDVSAVSFERTSACYGLALRAVCLKADV